MYGWKLHRQETKAKAKREKVIGKANPKPEFKHNKASTTLLDSLPPATRKEVLDGIAKEMPKATNRAVKTAALSATHKQLCLDDDARRLGEGVGDLSNIWSPPVGNTHDSHWHKYQGYE